jgi:predicted phage tail protein
MSTLAMPQLPQLPQLREVRLYGPLRAQFGRSHWLAVDSPAEAVQALCCLFQGFRQALLGHTGPGYRVLVGEGVSADARTEETLVLSAGHASVIRIAPVIHGNKKAGLGMIIAGVALLVVAPYLGSLVAGALGGTAGLVVGSAVIAGSATLGKAMILGGVVQLLSPQRKGSGSQADKQSSYNFNGPVNVTEVGGPVPLIIGRMIVGSVQASAGVSTDEYVPPSITLPTNPTRPPDEPIDWRLLPGADLP